MQIDILQSTMQWRLLAKAPQCLGWKDPWPWLCSNVHHSPSWSLECTLMSFFFHFCSVYPCNCFNVYQQLKIRHWAKLKKLTVEDFMVVCIYSTLPSIYAFWYSCYILHYQPHFFLLVSFFINFYWDKVSLCSVLAGLKSMPCLNLPRDGL